jgi:hypothetical protein
MIPGNLVFFENSNGFQLATYGSIPASDLNSISNSMMSVTGAQLLNPKDITLPYGKTALQFDYYYQPVLLQPNGDIGGTFTPPGNQLYIGGIAIIENGILNAVTYSPEIAQNNADYMRQIIGMANATILIKKGSYLPQIPLAALLFRSMIIWGYKYDSHASPLLLVSAFLMETYF